MKVLQPGREQRGWSTEAKCTGKGNGDGGCGAKLLVEQGDLYRTHNYDYGGGHDTYVTFACPCCGVETDIAEFKVPGNVLDTLLDKKVFFLGLDGDSRYKDCPTIMAQVKKIKAEQRD